MKDFYKHLDLYNAVPEADLAKVENKIWDQYGIEKAVLVLDMSGFSSTVQKHGIIHYLSMIRRMQVVAESVVTQKQFGGEIVKFEADNLFAIFDTTNQAIRAAISINIGMSAMNTITEDSRDIFISIGISYGKILLVPGEDFFGDAVNVASKLGEDIAERGEVLVTSDSIPEEEIDKGIDFKKVTYSISGISLKAYKIQY